MSMVTTRGSGVVRGTPRDLAPHLAAEAAQPAHAIDPLGAWADVARRDVVEVVERSLAIGIEDARLAPLQDDDLPLGQAFGSRQSEEGAGDRIGAVRAAQDQDRPLAGLGEDLIGFLEPGTR